MEISGSMSTIITSYVGSNPKCAPTEPSFFYNRRSVSYSLRYKPQIFNYRSGQHEAYYKSKHAQTIQDPSSKNSFVFLKDEMLKIEESFKVGLESDLSS